MTVLFLVGEPGCGKTTLAKRLIEPDSYLIPSPKWTVGMKVCAAGHYSGSTFDGADTVPYNGVDAALTLWEADLRALPLTIFDGDRFSNAGVVERLRASGAQQGLSIRCIHLHVPENIAASRRAQRGSNQNPSWLKGRKTKAARFAAMPLFDGSLDLSSEMGPAKLEALTRAFLDQ